MTVADVTVKGTLDTVQEWIDRGYALFVPDSWFCLAHTGMELPEDSIIELLVPELKCSFVQLFMVHKKPLLEGRVSHLDAVRVVLAREIITPSGRATGVVHLEPFTASDEQVAELLKEILGVAMEKE